MAVCTHCATPLPDGSRFCSHCGTSVKELEADSPTLSPQSQELFDRLQEATEGRYEILSELGRGGMAVVFLGFQESLERYVAIKVLLPFLGFDTELVQRFLREARTQGKLDHPHIIKVYEVHNEAGLTFFTMPFVGGLSLRKHLEDEPQPPFAKVNRYLSQAAEALSYAHRRGVIHRDVKPDNMLIDEDRDCVILTDFGIAKALSAETTLTTPGDLLGTPQYMSPEQGEGKQDLDGRADQYSLGLIGYEMLAGRRPFDSASLAELMYQHRFEEPESLEALRPDVPLATRLTIARAIKKDREDRFPTMDAFLAALESGEIAEHEEPTVPMPVAASDDTTVRMATPPRRAGAEATPQPSEATAARGRGGRSRKLVLGAGATVLALVAALTVFGPLRPFAQSFLAGDSGEQPGQPNNVAAVLPETEEATASDEMQEPGGEGDAAEGGETQQTGATQTEDVPVDATAGDPGTSEQPPVVEETEGPADTDPADPDRAVAEQGRADVAAARNAALEASAAVLFTQDLAALDDTLSQADRMMEAGLFDMAAQRYVALSDSYDGLTARSADAVERGALEAVAARDAAELRRQDAMDAGARERPMALMRANVLLTEGRKELDAGSYSAATGLFNQAQQAYARLAAALAGEAVDAERPEELPAEAQIERLIVRFGELFEQEDLPGMARELYRAPVPDPDRQFYSAVFERADEIQLTRIDREVTVDGSTALADARLQMTFVQARTGENRSDEWRVELRFASGPRGWRLEGVRPRR